MRNLFGVRGKRNIERGKRTHNKNQRGTPQSINKRRGAHKGENSGSPSFGEKRGRGGPQGVEVQTLEPNIVLRNGTKRLKEACLGGEVQGLGRLARNFSSIVNQEKTKEQKTLPGVG